MKPAAPVTRRVIQAGRDKSGNSVHRDAFRQVPWLIHSKAAVRCNVMTEHLIHHRQERVEQLGMRAPHRHADQLGIHQPDRACFISVAGQPSTEGN